MIKYGMIGMLMMTVPAVQVSAQADAPSFAIFEHRPSATAAEPAEPSFAAQSEMDWGASKAAPSFREAIYVANVREAELRYGLPVGLLQALRSEEHTSELQSLMRISYAVFCLKKKIIKRKITK